MKKITILLVLLCLFTGIAWYISTQPAKPAVEGLSVSSSPTPTPSMEVSISPSVCTIHNATPDEHCTPGAIFPEATKDIICVSGYTAKVRDVSVSLKRKVYAEYGFSYPQPSGAFEVDHFIPLELGGSNELANLWPEAADPNPGFHQKDVVENYLHAQVCKGKMPLSDAQRIIAHDWLEIYNQIPH